jgi:hypothetical protein
MRRPRKVGRLHPTGIRPPIEYREFAGVIEVGWRGTGLRRQSEDAGWTYVSGHRGSCHSERRPPLSCAFLNEP